MTKEELNQIEELMVRVLNKEIVPLIENIDKRLDRVEKVMATKDDIKKIEKVLKNHELRLDRHAVLIDRLLQS